jgi:hypothetical protein
MVIFKDVLLSPSPTKSSESQDLSLSAPGVTPKPTATYPPTVVFEDKFDAGIKPVWQSTCSWLTSNGRLVMDSKCRGGMLTVGDTNWGSFVLDIDTYIQSYSDTSFQILFGYGTETGYYAFEAGRYGIALNSVEGKSRYTVPTSNQTNNWCEHLKFEINGTKLKLSGCDKVLYDFVLPRSVSGPIGIYAADSYMQFDNFTVSKYRP